MPRQVIQPLLRPKPGQALFFVVLNVTDHLHLASRSRVQFRFNAVMVNVTSVHIRMLIAWPGSNFWHASASACNSPLHLFSRNRLPGHRQAQRIQHQPSHASRPGALLNPPVFCASQLRFSSSGSSVCGAVPYR